MAIIVEGIRFDTISAIIPLEDATGTLSVSSHIERVWAMWRDGTHPRDAYGDQKQEDAFVQTLFMARDSKGNKLTFPLSRL